MSAMMRTLRSAASRLVFAVLSTFAAPAFGADVDHGRDLYKACAACHTEKPDAVGPSLKGVLGRKSAERDDFRYSNAMKRANLVWDEANLQAYIANPQGKIPGNRMPFGGLSDPKDIDDVVAFLKTLK
jgi:cytochrome c